MADIINLNTDGNINDVVDLKESGNPISIPTAELTATIATLAAKRLGGLSPEEAQHKYGLYYDLALQNQKKRITSELLSLKIKRLDELGQLAISEAALNGDTETIKDISDFQYLYNPEKDEFSIAEVEAAEAIVEEGSEDTDREIQLTEEANIPSMSYSDMSAEVAAEKLMLTKLVRKYADRLGWGTIPEILQSMIPLYTMNSFSQKIDTGDKNNDFWTGQDIEDQVTKFRRMTTEEKASVLKSLDDFFDGKGGFNAATFSQYPFKALENVAQGQGNNLLALSYFSYLMDFAGWEQGLENVVHGADMLIVGGPIAKAVKGGVLLANIGRKLAAATVQGKLITAGIITGNRSSAVKQAINVHDAVKTGKVSPNSEVAAEVAELTVTKSINPLSELGDTAGVSGRVNKSLDEQELLAKEILETPQVKYLDPEEAKVLAQALAPTTKMINVIESVTEHVDIVRVIDDKVSITEDLEGIKFNVFFGNKDGQGFASYNIAEDYASQLKIEGATVTTIEEQGTYFIKFTRPIAGVGDKETGFITAYKGIDIDTGQISKVVEKFAPETAAKLKLAKAGGARVFLASPTNYVDASSRLAGHKVSGIQENVSRLGNKLMKDVTKLSWAEKTGLGEVLELGRKLEGWFDLNTLKNRFSLTDNQILAYNSIKLMDDINWKVTNSSVYSRLQREGFHTLKINKEKAVELGIDSTFNAKPLDTIANADHKTIYNITTGKYLDSGDVKELTKLKSKGYVFASLEGSRDTEKLSAVQYIIGSSSDIKVKPLALKQVPYIAGGRIEYAGTHFVKQGRISKTKAGLSILLRSRTHGVGTQAEATIWAKKMEAGRKVANDSLSDTGKVVATVDQDKAMQLATGGLQSSVAKYVEYVGLKNLSMPFEAVTDGQELRSVLQEVAKGVNRHPADAAEVNTIQRMMSPRWGDHKSKRGIRKFGFDGSPAPVINPMDAASKSLTRALNLITLDKWKARHIDKFFRTFGEILEDSINRSPASHFLEPRYIKKPNAAQQVLINQARGMQAHYRAILNTPTIGDRIITEAIMAPLANVLDATSTLLGKPLKYETVDKIASMNPINWARHMAYHSHLGLYNLKQPLVQLQATLLMIAANPKNGTKAAWLTAPMRLMLMSDNPQTLGLLAKGAGKVIGMKSEEIKELYDILQKSGTWRLRNGSLIEQTLHKNTKDLKSSNLAQKFLDYGTVPFLESERMNKVAATMSSAMDWRAANPGAKVTDDAIDIIRSRAELYVANMNRVDRSMWQRGVLSLPTQFWSYQARALEMMIPTMLGGSKHFTGVQKFRMVVAQLGLYGIGGMLSPRYGLRIRETLDQMHNERYGEDLPKTVGDTIESGIIEMLIAKSLNIEVSFANRAGLGLSESGISELLKHIATLNIKELKKFDAVSLEVLDKTLTAASDLISVINPKGLSFASQKHARVIWEVTHHHLKNIVSSYNAGDRFRWAMEQGKWIDTAGNITDENTTTMEAVFGLMGLDPGDSVTKRAMKQALQEDRNKYKFIVDILANQANIALRSEGFEQWKLYNTLMLGLLGNLEDADKEDILQRAYKKAGRDENSIMLDYAEKYKGATPLSRED
jgi:hypothetical protein